MNKEKPREITCHHCGEPNPPKAYCCEHCLKVIRKRPALLAEVRPSVAVLVISLTVFGCGFWVLKKWLQTVEAKMTINVKTAEYNFSVIADKKRHQLSLINLEDQASPDQTPSTSPTEEQ